jgi:hypothetical protein
MRLWIVGLAVGVASTVISAEISIIAVVLAVVAVIFLGLVTPPRYAFLSGGLMGVGAVWLAGTVPLLDCQGTVAACGNPYPLIGLAAALVVIGLVAGLATARASTSRSAGPR